MMCKDLMLADMVTIIGTQDIVFVKLIDNVKLKMLRSPLAQFDIICIMPLF